MKKFLGKKNLGKKKCPIGFSSLLLSPFSKHPVVTVKDESLCVLDGWKNKVHLK